MLSFKFCIPIKSKSTALRCLKKVSKTLEEISGENFSKDKVLPVTTEKNLYNPIFQSTKHVKESSKKILKVKIYRCFVAIGKQALQRGRKMKSLKFNQGQRDFELTVEGKFPHNMRIFLRLATYTQIKRARLTNLKIALPVVTSEGVGCSYLK